MGYYTDYRIEVKGDCDAEEIAKALERISEYGFYNINETTIVNDDTIKWYDWEEQMTEISKSYPNNLFTVDGEGEENQDFWRSVFKDGRKESIEIKIKYKDSVLEQEFDASEVVHEILTET